MKLRAAPSTVSSAAASAFAREQRVDFGKLALLGWAILQLRAGSRCQLTGLVCRSQSAASALQHFEHLAPLSRLALHPLAQRRAIDELHGDVIRSSNVPTSCTVTTFG